jgi:hypothetical protein
VRAGDCSLLDLGWLSFPPRPPRPFPLVGLFGELLRESSAAEAAGDPKMRSRASAYLRSFSARSFCARALRSSKPAAAFLRRSSSLSSSRSMPAMLRERTCGVGLRASMVTLGLKVAATGAGRTSGYHWGSGFSADSHSFLLSSACWALSCALVSFGFGWSSTGFSSSFYRV